MYDSQSTTNGAALCNKPLFPLYYSGLRTTLVYSGEPITYMDDQLLPSQIGTRRIENSITVFSAGRSLASARSVDDFAAKKINVVFSPSVVGERSRLD